MKKWDGYQKGVNIGGWLSQCNHTKEHYDSFFTEQDIERIAGWGLDHVRLPIDYDLIQDAEGNIKEEGFVYIDNCLAWCEKQHLNMILDLHKTQGFSFDEGEKESGFFGNARLEQMFIDLWEAIAQRYVKYADRLAFELLNEVVDEADNAPWMEVAKKTVDMIRTYSKDVKILIGSYMNNSALTVKCIPPAFDKNIVYNFHCYEPLLFTHQGASWARGMQLDFRTTYPTDKTIFIEKGREFDPTFSVTESYLKQDTLNTDYFENWFAEAIAYAEEQDVCMYCGEYGVIDLADTESTLNWYRDINAVFKKHGIGRAAWTYKGLNFGIMDEHMASVRDELIQYL